jgi:hypothetical protein
VLVRQHERWVEELNVQLQLQTAIAASGSVLTLPAATLDLQDRMGDQREFLPVHYDDWQQVIGDCRDCLANSGPKILAVTAPHTTAIDALLPSLTSSYMDANGSRICTMDPVVRARRVPVMLSPLCPHSGLFLLLRSLFRLGCTRFGSPGIFG